MATDTTKTQAKITYATMSAERMEDLHRELDRAIEGVKGTFGRTYPMFAGGRELHAEAQFEDRSPIDTRIVLGRFQSGGREHVRRAIEAARAAYPDWSGRPWRRPPAGGTACARGSCSRRRPSGSPCRRPVSAASSTMLP